MSENNFILINQKPSLSQSTGNISDLIKTERKNFRTMKSMPRPVRHIPNGFSANQPALIEKFPLKFVITDSPSDKNISSHIRNLQKYNVKHVCRAANTVYSTDPFVRSGIQPHDFAFPDGNAPPPEVLNKWLELVKDFFLKSSEWKRASPGGAEKGLRHRQALRRAKSNPVSGSSKASCEWSEQRWEEGESISVHCVAGLGRAPVLVAVALIEFAGLTPKEAVELIRRERRGAINSKQIEWLQNYKRMYKHSRKGGCRIS